MTSIWEVAAFLLVVAVVGTAGIAVGILWIAPRLTRRVERSDEEPGGRDD